MIIGSNKTTRILSTCQHISGRFVGPLNRSSTFKHWYLFKQKPAHTFYDEFNFKAIKLISFFESVNNFQMLKVATLMDRCVIHVIAPNEHCARAKPTILTPNGMLIPFLNTNKTPENDY